MRVQQTDCVSMLIFHLGYFLVNVCVYVLITYACRLITKVSSNIFESHLRQSRIFIFSLSPMGVKLFAVCFCVFS